MAHHTTHRRNLAPLDSKLSIDPQHKKHPISSSTSTSTTKPHHQDPTIPPPSTVQIISNHFSKLYTNHKILTTLKPSSTCHFQEKPMIVCSNMDNSCSTLTKTKSQHGRNVKEKVVKVKVPFEVHDMEKTLLKQKVYEIKKQPSSKKHEEEQQHEAGDEMKRPSFSLAVNGGGGRRRSFCSSQTELADFFSCNGVKVVSVDMPPFMQIHAVDCARKAYDSLEKFTARTLAYSLKKEFDGVYGPAWHCIVGTSFGSFVTHSVGGFMYFSMDHKLYILLFKTTVQKAE